MIATHKMMPANATENVELLEMVRPEAVYQDPVALWLAVCDWLLAQYWNWYLWLAGC